MKTVLILSADGGGGHISAAQAITHALPEFDVKTVCTFDTVLGKTDPLSILTGNRWNIHHFYNYCLYRRWYPLVNFHEPVLWYLKAQSGRIKRMIGDYIDKTNPVAIISVAPIVNWIILQVAQERNIPFIMIPTDLDSSLFLPGIKKPSYYKLRVCIPFNDPQIHAYINKAQLNEEQLVVTGFPIRPDFFNQADSASIKKEFGIPSGKPVVMVMLGAQGSRIAYEFADQLSQVHVPMHAIICLGKQEQLKEHILQLRRNPHVSFTVLGFTSRIADLMSISDLIITKSGTVSICEAMYKELPMILDATGGVLRWERFNHNFITGKGFGTCLTQIKQTCSMVTELLLHPTALHDYKKNLINFDKNHGTTHIKAVLNQLLQ